VALPPRECIHRAWASNGVHFVVGARHDAGRFVVQLDGGTLSRTFWPAHHAIAAAHTGQAFPPSQGAFHLPCRRGAPGPPPPPEPSRKKITAHASATAHEECPGEHVPFQIKILLLRAENGLHSLLLLDPSLSTCRQRLSPNLVPFRSGWNCQCQSRSGSFGFRNLSLIFVKKTRFSIIQFGNDLVGFFRS